MKINIDKIQLLPKSFYKQADVVQISKDLLGKYLFTYIEDCWTGGIIVETEAYCGATDKACHAYQNKRTKRTETMFQQGGISYVYLCYGIHSLFNVVTNVKDQADAILIRAIEPRFGIDKMLERRKMERTKKGINRRMTAGPGCLTQALGIDTSMNGLALDGPLLYIADECPQNGIKSKTYKDKEIIASSRIGIGYAEEDALLPWRFRITNNKWTSLAK